MKLFRTGRFGAVDSLLKLIELTPPSDRILLRVLFFAIIFSGIYTLYTLNQVNVAETPVRGGVLREGIVGTPRFVNPVLANTRADQDMTALVYDGMMKIDPNGTLTPNLAESVTVSEDGLTYNVVLRGDALFHDGHPVTAQDVAFTIALIQDPDLKSPLRGNWTDVNVEVLNDRELNIILLEAYAPFIENFTVGIMPEHLWSSLSVEQMPFSQLNTEPVGAGPFSITTAMRDESGVIVGYELTAFRGNLNQPNIETIRVSFYTDEAALLTAMNAGLLDSSAYVSYENLDAILSTGSFVALEEPLPRVFGIFFNQNKSPALLDDAVREALATAIDRDELIATTLYGYGVPIDGPVTRTQNAVESEERSSGDTESDEIATARQILEEAGWRTNSQGLLEKQIDDSTETLRIALKTSNVPLFIAVSNLVKRQWEALGVEVTIDQYEQSGLVQSVIRPRDFEALLFGLDMNRSQDLYPFWHSSQKDDPGLNVAQYTNLSVDALLEEARMEQEETARLTLLNQAADIIKSEHPAVFLFQPVTVYVVDTHYIVPDMAHVVRPSDRFSNMSEWYTNSDELWSVFR